MELNICPDINTRLLHIIDFKSLIRMTTLNKEYNCHIKNFIFYQELSRLANCRIKYKFGSYDIIGQYYKFDMVNIISYHKFDYHYSLILAVKNKSLNILKLIHQASNPDFRYGKFYFNNEYYFSKFIYQVISNVKYYDKFIFDFLYQAYPDFTIKNLKKLNYSNSIEIINWILENLSSNSLSFERIVNVAIKNGDLNLLEFLKYKGIITIDFINNYNRIDWKKSIFVIILT